MPAPQIESLEQTKCATEARDLYLDGVISQYGVGAKNASFCLGNVLKVQSHSLAQQ
jgi:hypothetical protein